MSTFSILFEAGYSGSPDDRADEHLFDFSVFQKNVEPSLGGARRKIQTSAQHDAGLEPHDRRRYPAFGGFNRIDEEISIRFLREDGDENGSINEDHWPQRSSISSFVTSLGLGPAIATVSSAIRLSRSRNGGLSRSRFSSLRSAWAMASVMLVLRNLASSRASSLTSASRILMAMTTSR